VAPEPLDGAPAHAATDVYALGVLMYEMLTGEPPFRADNWDDLAAIQRSDVPPSPRNVPGLPLDVARLCQSCLDPNPTRRPSAEVVVDRLRAFVTTPCHPVAPRADLHRTVPRTVPAPATAGHAAPPAVWGRRTVVAVGAAVAVVTVGALLVVLNHDGGRAGQPQALLPPPQTTPAAVTSAAPTVATTSPSPRPHRTTSPPPRTSAPATTAPSPTPGLTLAAAAAQFNRLVDTGEANGAIRKDVADDLQQVLNNALHAPTPAEVHNGLVLLRGKVQQRSTEAQSITPTLSQQLLDSVDQMLEIAPVTPTAA
jgi:hypothetical protein